MPLVSSTSDLEVTPFRVAYLWAADLWVLSLAGRIVVVDARVGAR